MGDAPGVVGVSPPEKARMVSVDPVEAGDGAGEAELAVEGDGRRGDDAVVVRVLGDACDLVGVRREADELGGHSDCAVESDARFQGFEPGDPAGGGRTMTVRGATTSQAEIDHGTFPSSFISVSACDDTSARRFSHQSRCPECGDITAGMTCFTLESGRGDFCRIPLGVTGAVDGVVPPDSIGASAMPSSVVSCAGGEGRAG